MKNGGIFANKSPGLLSTKLSRNSLNSPNSLKFLGWFKGQKEGRINFGRRIPGSISLGGAMEQKKGRKKIAPRTSTEAEAEKRRNLQQRSLDHLQNSLPLSRTCVEERGKANKNDWSLQFHQILIKRLQSSLRYLFFYLFSNFFLSLIY